MNNTATNTATCPTVRKQIGKTTYIVRVHFSETAKETIQNNRFGTCRGLSCGGLLQAVKGR